MPGGSAPRDISSPSFLATRHRGHPPWFDPGGAANFPGIEGWRHGLSMVDYGEFSWWYPHRNHRKLGFYGYIYGSLPSGYGCYRHSHGKIQHAIKNSKPSISIRAIYTMAMWNNQRVWVLSLLMMMNVWMVIHGYWWRFMVNYCGNYWECGCSSTFHHRRLRFVMGVPPNHWNPWWLGVHPCRTPPNGEPWELLEYGNYDGELWDMEPIFLKVVFSNCLRINRKLYGTMIKSQWGTMMKKMNSEKNTWNKWCFTTLNTAPPVFNKRWTKQGATGANFSRRTHPKNASGASHEWHFTSMGVFEPRRYRTSLQQTVENCNEKISICLFVEHINRYWEVK